MLDKILWLILLTFTPVFELRWSIPIGLFSGSIEVPFLGVVQGFALPLAIVFVTCVISNIVLGAIVYFLLDKVIPVLRHISFIDRAYLFFVNRVQKRSEKIIKKYGLLGVALFVAIPLPGSGSWTGALVAYLLNLGYKKFFIANAIGVLISATIVTILSIGVFAFLTL